MGAVIRIRGVVVLESRQGMKGDGAEQHPLASPRKQTQLRTKGPFFSFTTRERGQKKDKVRLTLSAGISTLSPRLMEPERMVPVITVPWPLMEKQWSTDMRNGPEGSLVGMEIWDVRS